MTAAIAPTTQTSPVSIRPRSVLDDHELLRLERELSGLETGEVIAWATARFGRRLVLTSSFADTLLIDLAVRADPDIEVVFLDTGFHFSETLDTVRKAMTRYSLNLTVLRPDGDADDLWATGVEACCRDRKVEPLDRHLLDHADAWLSGLRRADSPQRAATPIIHVDRRGLVKINPIAGWSNDQVAEYRAAHDVIVNPLLSQGYPSVGCWPCTARQLTNEGDRTGRWAGSTKTECGLHL